MSQYARRKGDLWQHRKCSERAPIISLSEVSGTVLSQIADETLALWENPHQSDEPYYLGEFCMFNAGGWVDGWYWSDTHLGVWLSPSAKTVRRYFHTMRTCSLHTQYTHTPHTPRNTNTHSTTSPPPGKSTLRTSPQPLLLASPPEDPLYGWHTHTCTQHTHNTSNNFSLNKGWEMVQVWCDRDEDEDEEWYGLEMENDSLYFFISGTSAKDHDKKKTSHTWPHSSPFNKWMNPNSVPKKILHQLTYI